VIFFLNSWIGKRQCKKLNNIFIQEFYVVDDLKFMGKNIRKKVLDSYKVKGPA
jgi:hypothetical protein